MWQWIRANGLHVTEMVNLTQECYENEIDHIFTPEPLVLARNLTISIVNQFYNPNAEYVSIAVQDNKILAYTWAQRNVHCPWSDDEMVDVRIAHVDLNLSPRVRVKLLNEMLDQWELWAIHNNIPIINSSTVRNDQAAFIKLHERRGYSVRGSVCYKKINHASRNIQTKTGQMGTSES